jgi:hypothetical protein
MEVSWLIEAELAPGRRPALVQAWLSCGDRGPTATVHHIRKVLHNPSSVAIRTVVPLPLTGRAGIP